MSKFADFFNNLFPKEKSTEKIVDEIINDIKERGSYFPAILGTEFGEIHLLVLHEDADKFIKFGNKVFDEVKHDSELMQ